MCPSALAGSSVVNTAGLYVASRKVHKGRVSKEPVCQKTATLSQVVGNMITKKSKSLVNTKQFLIYRSVEKTKKKKKMAKSLILSSSPIVWNLHPFQTAHLIDLGHKASSNEQSGA